jgi:hypothetical protein
MATTGIIQEKEAINKSGFKSAAWEKQEKAWKITSDLWESALFIREQSTTYLDQFNKEPSGKYEFRKNNSVFINEFRSAIETMAGMVFKENPTPVNAPPVISELFTDIDLLGNNLHSFLLDSFIKFLRDGNGYFYVDASPMSETVKAKLEEGVKPLLSDRKDDRPFLVFYHAAQIINHQYVRSGSKEYLAKVTIEERTCEPAGLFGEKEVIRHRILTPGKWELRKFESENDVQADKYTEDGMGVTGLDEIPLIPVTSIGSTPIFLVLALLNILHYNKTSDFDDIIHVICTPERIYNYNTEEDAIKSKDNGTISPGIARNMWGEFARASFNEVSGNGVDIAKLRYQDIEELMAKQGVGMLKPSNIYDAKTATEILDTTGQRQSKLAKYARDFENAVEKSLYLLAQMVNAIKGKGTLDLPDAETQWLKLKIDYDRLTFSMEQLSLFSAMVDKGKLSLLTFLEWLQMSTEMPRNFDPEAEMKRITEEVKTRPAIQDVGASQKVDPKVTVGTKPVE